MNNIQNYVKDRLNCNSTIIDKFSPNFYEDGNDKILKTEYFMNEFTDADTSFKLSYPEVGNGKGYLIIMGMYAGTHDIINNTNVFLISKKPMPNIPRYRKFLGVCNNTVEDIKSLINDIRKPDAEYASISIFVTDNPLIHPFSPVKYIHPSSWEKASTDKIVDEMINGFKGYDSLSYTGKLDHPPVKVKRTRL